MVLIRNTSILYFNQPGKQFLTGGVNLLELPIPLLIFCRQDRIGVGGFCHPDEFFTDGSHVGIFPTHSRRKRIDRLYHRV